MQYRKLLELKELYHNPRVIKDKQFKQLCKSIKDNPDYFEARPLILSNRTGELVILAGNQRYKAALEIGLVKVPTFLIEGLTEDREKEIIIRDNISNGYWDFELLANEWDDLPLIDWGLDLPTFENDEKVSDEDEFDKTADSYLNGTIRQIVLYYDIATHTEVLQDLELIGKEFGIDEDNSAVVQKLIGLHLGK